MRVQDNAVSNNVVGLVEMFEGGKRQRGYGITRRQGRRVISELSLGDAADELFQQ